MRSRSFHVLFLLFFLSFILPGTVSAQEVGEKTTQEQLPQYTIAFLYDGAMANGNISPSFFQKEITQIAKGEFDVIFPEEFVIQADSTLKGIENLLDSLLANPEVDLVVTIGAIGSTIACGKKNLPKPVVAPFIFDGELQNAPRIGISSGVSNLFYMNLNSPIDQELIQFRKLVPFKKLGFLIDKRDLEHIPAVTKFVKSLSFEHSIDVFIIPVENSATDVLAQIPADLSAVMVGPIWQMSDSEVALLSEGLIANRIAGFTIASYDLVEKGLFATTMPKNGDQQLARQMAIAIQEILLGEDPKEIPVNFSRGQKLTINMQTARAINRLPSLDYTTGANLLNAKKENIGRKVTFTEIVQEALSANLDLAVAEQDVLAGNYKVNEARSALLPQLGIGAGGRVIDEDRAFISQGTSPEQVLLGSLSFSQQIYSERSWSNFSVEKDIQGSREYDRDTIKLDIIYQAAVSYLNVLRSETAERLQKENMLLTQANLERAQIRLNTGVAGPDELYRWQSEFANSRQTVLKAESTTRTAKQSMNRIVNRPLSEDFFATEMDLKDPLIIGGNKIFYQLIHNPGNFNRFNSFALQKGLAEAPELKVIDKAISAQERLLTESGRDYWVPTVSLEASLDHNFQESGAGQRNEEETGLDETSWQATMMARLPLFEGGRKNATHAKNKIQLRQLKIERKAAEERISQLILESLNNTRASYPSINLSRDSVDAARRNLQLITDSYIQGIKSIIELLDAQTQALNAELDAANAVYNFLIDFMGVQRSIGSFITFSTAEEREEWVKKVKLSILNDDI